MSTGDRLKHISALFLKQHHSKPYHS